MLLWLGLPPPLTHAREWKVDFLCMILKKAVSMSFPTHLRGLRDWIYGLFYIRYPGRISDSLFGSRYLRLEIRYSVRYPVSGITIICQISSTCKSYTQNSITVYFVGLKCIIPQEIEYNEYNWNKQNILNFTKRILALNTM